MRDVTLTVIGTVRNGRASAADQDWGSVVSTLEIAREFAAGLEGLGAFSHVIVLFYMHLDPDREPPALVHRPRSRADMPALGVFAQRVRMRPNPLGVTACEVVRVHSGPVVCSTLDALQGTT